MLSIQRLKFKGIFYYQVHHLFDNDFESNKYSLYSAQTLTLMCISVSPDLLNKK